MHKRIGFAVLLNDESFNFARSVELGLCNKFSLCAGLKQSPHITIKSPFYTDNITPFLRYFEDIVSTIKLFDIEITGFNYFGSGVIFMEVKENPELRGFHRRLVDDLAKKFGIQPNAFDGDKFKFHSTIALNDIKKNDLPAIKKYLGKYKANFIFQARHFGVFYFLGPDAGWIIIKKITLSYS